jgi:adenosylmethionine-8-amino-7-oxononanoate aminotransferase
LAATLATEEIFEGFLGEFDEFRTFFHGHTYTGNPVACAVALENLRLFEDENLLQKVRTSSESLKRLLSRFYDLAHVGEVRQKGFMVGIELVENRRAKKAYGPGEKIGQKVVWEARKHGVIIRPLGDVIVLMPPLAIEEPVLEELVAVTYKSIATVTGA